MLAISTLFDRRHRRVIIFMAGTRAVSELGHRVVGIAIFFMLTRLVVIRMAASAVRRISSARIRHRLCVALVAVQAIERLGMRSGIIGRFVQVI